MENKTSVCSVRTVEISWVIFLARSFWVSLFRLGRQTCRDSGKLAFWIPLRFCFRSSSFSPSALDFPSFPRATPTLDGKTNGLKNVFFICPLDEGWPSVSLLHTPTAPTLGQRLGVGERGNDRRGRKGSHCFFWSGTTRSNPGQNKQAKGRSHKPDGQHMALAWNRNFNSALPTPCIPQKRRFYTLAFFF